MAAISVTIPDALLQRVLDGFAGQYGYAATIPDPNNPSSNIPNPQTKAAFTKQRVLEFIQQVVIAWEAKNAGETARIAAVTKAQNEIILS